MALSLSGSWTCFGFDWTGNDLFIKKQNAENEKIILSVNEVQAVRVEKKKVNCIIQILHLLAKPIWC